MADKDGGMEERARGIFGRERKKDTTPAVEKSSLPELRLTQTVKSPEPIIKVEPNMPITPEACIIQPYREYTIVLAKDSKEIQILDKQGNKIEGLDNTSIMIFDWLAYRKGVKRDISEREDSQDEIRIDAFPEGQRRFVRDFFNKNRGGSSYVPMPSASLTLTNLAKAHAIRGDDYVLFSESDNYSFIGFQTKNAQGIELPPRNWKRVDTVNEYELDFPADVALALKEFRASGSTSFGGQIENGFSVITDKEKLVVVKTGQKIENPEFTDRVAIVGNNVCLDPRVPGVIYYCTSNNPRTIYKLDTTKDVSTWQTEAIEIPQEYRNIRNLRLDPTGNFFTFESSGDFVILAKDTLQEAKRIPKLINATSDDQGKIRGIDENGHLVIYDTNFQEAAQEVDKRRIARLAKGLTADLFKKETAVVPRVEVEQFQHLVLGKTDLETKFDEQFQTTATLEDISNIREALGKLRTRLAGERLPPDQISFITQGIEASISGKEHALALPIVTQGLADLNTKLAGNLTIALLSEAKADLARLKSMEGFVDAETRDKIIALENQLGTQSSELFKTQGVIIEKDVNDLVAGVRSELDKMDNAFKFADWQEFTLPQLKVRLGNLARDCPLEAHELQQKILDARRSLQDIDREYGIKFKEKYAQVREKASETMTAAAELMQVDIDSFVNRLREKGLKDRLSANTYIGGSESLKLLKDEIAELKSNNPDAAKDLERSLNAQIALVMSEIERRGSTKVAQTGQQMILFGDTLFPRWEGKVHEKVKRQVDIIFIPDEKTKGPGVAADKILGDIGIMEIGSTGKVEKRRLYEGMNKENEWRYGEVSYRGEDVFPAYLSNIEFRQIKKDYADWSKGDVSSLKKEFNGKRQALKDQYAKRQKIGQRDGQDSQWQEEYKRLLQDYAKFAQEHHVLLLNRIDQVRNAPETEFANGSGYVPKWSSHWVKDAQTEAYLEQMAKYAKMQLDLQDGLLNLKGHAGTGKDVLVKMFCSEEGGTNRPYFTIDCSKWTTEFELSEDVILEAEDGASKTVKVPSVVLNAITTPGAVMYFNEMNAMPEQAQIFLHGLMDEKRTLTLKTSSGKAIRADKTVILMGSMNPGYPGTFNPGFATKSRMMNLEIDYPPLYKEKDNPNSPISASEALRIARGVDSLVDFTWEANPEHNEFVKIWDRYVNGVQNDAPELTRTQKFDVDVILSLVQFGNKLREGFILKFEKAGGAAIKGKLLVDQPITGRDMRRCAYFLSKIPEATKTTANPEQIARDLLSELFLSSIDAKIEREKIEDAMKTWTSSKKVASN